MTGLETVWTLLAHVAGAAHPNGDLIAVWFLSAMFAFTGIEKLRHSDRAALALVDFRLVRRFDRRWGLAAGGTEVAVAVALVAGRTPMPAALAAASLLWFFTWLLARSLVRGDRFACFCFGDLDADISLVGLARTVVLALLTSALVADLVIQGSPVASAHTEVVTALAGIALFGSALAAAKVGILLRLNRSYLYGGTRP
jgi:hypothetical protein